MSITRNSPVGTLAALEGQVASGLTEAIELACPSQPRLRAALAHVLSITTDPRGHSPRRLFAAVVLGAITGEPEPAVPVCVVSNLWWAGAEALDDLMDAGGEADASLSRAGLLTACIACMTAVPEAFIAASSVPDELRLTWMAETAGSSLGAAEGQLADMAREPSALSWRHVMATYVGKTGVAYARDAVMAAQLGTSNAAMLRGWRAFGQIFGVLRQVHNDNTDDAPTDDEDLANGTPTLLLAHALDVLGPHERAQLLSLRAAAITDPAARVTMRESLQQPDITAGYGHRLDGIRRQACALLENLVGPSDFRHVLRSWIDSSYVLALPRQLDPTTRRSLP